MLRESRASSPMALRDNDSERFGTHWELLVINPKTIQKRIEFQDNFSKVSPSCKH